MARKSYLTYMKSARWKRIRKEALERADHTCQQCGATDRRLQIHHICYDRFGGAELPEDLRALCGGCHRIEHGLSGTYRDGKYKLIDASFLPARSQREKTVRWRKKNKEQGRKQEKKLGFGSKTARWHYRDDEEKNIAPARQVPVEEFTGYIPPQREPKPPRPPEEQWAKRYKAPKMPKWGLDVDRRRTQAAENTARIRHVLDTRALDPGTRAHLEEDYRRRKEAENAQKRLLPTPDADLARVAEIKAARRVQRRR